MPANRKFGKNNARTGGGIRAVRRTRPAHATPVFHFPKTGNLGRIPAVGKGIGRIERAFVGPDTPVVLIWNRYARIAAIGALPVNCTTKRPVILNPNRIATHPVISPSVAQTIRAKGIILTPIWH